MMLWKFQLTKLDSAFENKTENFKNSAVSQFFGFYFKFNATQNFALLINFHSLITQLTTVNIYL